MMKSCTTAPAYCKRKTNPSKEKTLQRPLFESPLWAINKVLMALPGRASKLWMWLTSNDTGWIFDVEQIAEQIQVGVRTVYRAVRDLVRAGALEVSDDVWRVLDPASKRQTPSATAVTPRDQEDRERLRARSSVENKKPCSASKAEIEPDRASEHQQAAGTQSRTEMRTTESRPSQAPETNDRPEVAQSDRMKPMQFVDQWRIDFPRQGPASATVLSPRWQERVLWIWRHWTRAEVHKAYVRTVEHCSTSASWSYFCRCLEAIARGEWNEEGPPSKQLSEAEKPQLWEAWKPWWDITLEQYQWLATTKYADGQRGREALETLWNAMMSTQPEKIPARLGGKGE